MTSFRYVGEELDVFALARNWKAYLKSLISAHLIGDVLEVGAGIGSTTRVLCDARAGSWTCLEPDAGLAARLERSIAATPLPVAGRVIVGTVSELPAAPAYDAIVYIDVLEHIEDDRGELMRAYGLLRRGGAVIVLSPAHQYLYTAFDEHIGHFRRYSRSMFRALTPAGATLEMLRYLDSAGMLLSAANRLLLRSGSPTASQVRVWDQWFVPASRRIDALLGWSVGKSLLGVWRRLER